MKKNLGMLIFLFAFYSNIHAGNSNQKYIPPQPFMNLFFDFAGIKFGFYPTDRLEGRISASQALIDSELALAPKNNQDGPLLLFINWDLYIYDENRNLLLNENYTSNPKQGVFEMGSLAHVMPALAYYVQVKENGSDAWRKGLKTMLDDLRAIKKLNSQKHNNWFDKLNARSWHPIKNNILNMVDYACSLTGNYIQYVLKTGDLNKKSFQEKFLLRADSDYPIPYQNVVIGSFMLTVLETLNSLDNKVTKLDINWAGAKIVVRNAIGTNFNAGAIAESNWVLPLVKALSGGKVTDEQIVLAPYAGLRSDLGKKKLSKDSFIYYRDKAWARPINEEMTAKKVFPFIPDLPKQKRKSLPGDYGVTKADDIASFVIRLKDTLSDRTKQIVNSVGYWLPGEYQAKKGQITKMDIPGVTTGFPKGVEGYPAHSPDF